MRRAHHVFLDFSRVENSHVMRPPRRRRRFRFSDGRSVVFGKRTDAFEIIKYKRWRFVWRARFSPPETWRRV